MQYGEMNFSLLPIYIYSDGPFCRCHFSNQSSLEQKLHSLLVRLVVLHIYIFRISPDEH